MARPHRRSNVEIIAEILQLDDVSKTDIMYDVNLSYRQLQKYLTFLVEEGFLEEHVVPNPGVKYKPTQKGRRFVESISPIFDMLGF